MIRTLYFNKTDIGTQFISKPTQNEISGLKQINIFIGQNNSGKSRLLRTIFAQLYKLHRKESPHYQTQANSISNTFNSNLNALRDDIYKQELSPELDKEVSRLIEQLIVQSSLLTESIIDCYEPLIRSLTQETRTLKNELLTLLKDSKNRELSKLASSSRTRVLDSSLPNYGRQQPNPPVSPSDYSRIYAPLLRGLRPINNTDKGKFATDDFYYERTIHDYFTNGRNPLNGNSGVSKSNIFTGLTLYTEVMEMLLGNESQRRLVADFEGFLQKNVFNNEPITLIPKIKDDVVHINIGGEERPIYQLGDGIQTLIILLFPVFKNRNNSCVFFFEEPETHLHPKWQKVFSDCLKQFDKSIFFISTHSNIFINQEGVSVYRVSREKEKSSFERVTFDSERHEVISSLGYKPSDILQSNYVIWVEGPSDKIYLNYWIKKIAPGLIENKDYTIMHLGGSAFKRILYENGAVQLKSLASLGRNMALILDSDKDKEDAILKSPIPEIKEAFEKANKFMWLTQKREIENYVPLETYRNAVATIHQKNKESIQLSGDDFENRCKISDPDADQQFKRQITLPEEVYRVIQTNGEVDSIGEQELKKAINQSLKAVSTFKVDKIRVANEVVRLEPELIGEEIKSKIKMLVEAIKGERI